jgi:hypothetical protein
MALGVTYTAGMTFSKIMCIFINYYFLCAVNADHTSILQYTEKENDSARRELRCT